MSKKADLAAARAALDDDNPAAIIPTQPPARPSSPTSDQDREVQINARIPDSLAKQFKATAAVNGDTIKNVLTELISEYIQRNQAERT